MKVDDSGYKEYTTDAEGFSKLYACPWKIGDGPIDLRKASVMTEPIVGEFPYAYGQLGNQVLSCTNIGGGYVFRDGKWRTVIDGSMKTSYQVYAMLTYYDRLLMGQYPTGELFSFDGETVTHLDGLPPKLPEVRGNSREAQTMMIYGGELYVGVWPWGEVWRYHGDKQEWGFAKRMFQLPELTDVTTHPYENETAALGGVANQWGQRVTSMVPLGSDMVISTSAKWPAEWEPKFDYIDAGRWKEYGTVTRVNVSGHLSAPLAWTDGPSELRFILDGNMMRIEQDGEVVAETVIEDGYIAKASGESLGTPQWGMGAYGVFNGKSLKGTTK